MSDTTKMEQQSLFPARDSLREVIEEAKASLPITNPNQLVSILQLHENTLIKQLEKQTCTSLPQSFETRYS